MKFYSWNVNGIRAVVKKGTFQKFVAEHRPDILCLQETKAEKGQAEIDLPESARRALISGTWDATALLLDNYADVEHTAARLPYLQGF